MLVKLIPAAVVAVTALYALSSLWEKAQPVLDVLRHAAP